MSEREGRKKCEEEKERERSKQGGCGIEEREEINDPPDENDP